MRDQNRTWMSGVYLGLSVLVPVFMLLLEPVRTISMDLESVMMLAILVLTPACLVFMVITVIRGEERNLLTTIATILTVVNVAVILYTVIFVF
ncbi:hypothetical protein KP77_09040 [Jeotgalibacillus alimentarius]|uniref:Uncharacterized protein n=1 Tax=Jeotgalibacillus alimentarius TaxID=135826 RepID=A0A0C2VR41_9BACL|nr:hypothetical protein [Jeotgalibacillus alimentarius]KIL51392.1 hypothetical protein KP77_09040 [Jeotgalibacillus alimentarius]